MVWRSSLSMALLAVALCLPSAASESSPSHIGKSVSDFTLDNCYGKPVSMSDFGEKQLVVVVFLGTECPLAKLYGPRLQALQTAYESDVVVLGVNSNTQDSLTELAAYAHRHQIEFPLLKDVGNRVADAMQAQRTPEVFLLDEDRVVRYHGRIDDQYGVGYSRDKSVKKELEAAIAELLAGNAVSNPETEPVGCHIGRVKKTQAVGDVTYTKDIARIFNARCVSCHREQEIAPFTLTSYDDVLGWEDTILEVIDDNRMPPWYADPSHGKFANDARLSQTERELIETWVENGMPEGDPADLPDPPTFTLGWRIPEPDEVFQMDDKPFDVPAQGVVDYQHFVVDPGWEEDKYISAAEARPQNRSVVHHILVYIIPPGRDRPNLRRVLVGYAPGSLPVQLDDGVAIHVPKGSRLLFQMHYTPNGNEQTDLSYAGVCFIDEKDVRRRIMGKIAMNARFVIPPGESHHEVFAAAPIRQDQMLLSMTPHMHLRGKAFEYVARYPDGESEVLLRVPNYDFNWQLKYILDEPKLLKAGTMIECTAVFDNSADNLVNPDPTRPVRWGDQSWEEMMIGFFDSVPVD